MDNDKTPLFAYAGSDCASRASPARALLLLASVLAVAATVLTVAVTTAAPPTADLITAPMPKKDLRHWILDDLSAEETRAVASYVLARRPGTRASLYGGQSGDYSDYISGTSSVELILPPKQEALAYVEGRTATPPARYARVTVVRGSLARPDVMEYRVGPIHGCDAGDCSAASVEAGSPLVPLLSDGAVSFEKRPIDVSDPTPFAQYAPLLLSLKSLLLESFGPVFDETLMPGCGTKCFSGADGLLTPFAFNDIASTAQTRVSKMQLFWYKDKANMQASWLHGLPFTFRVEQRGASQANTRIYDIYYCGQGPFDSAQALLAANVSKCVYRPSPKTSGSKGDWDVPGAREAANARTVPQLPPQPERRFALSGVRGGNGRLVEWEGWSFWVAMRPSTGLAALDVRFKGRRVAFEIALAEAVAFYSGTGNDQVFYLDSAFSMSQMGGDLMPGLDCPADAAYLDGTQWVLPAERSLESNISKARPYRALCVYEEVQPRPHWRHLQMNTKAVSGVPNTALVVRAITAVGNYDYSTEFRFGLDGSIRVVFDFAGYMETRWFSEAINPFERVLGEIVHENLAAPLHSHFGCFKVDLDSPAGESLERTTITAGRPTEVPDLRWPTKHVAREVVAKEGAGVSTSVPNPAKPGMWAIVDNSSPPAGARPDATPTGRPGYAISVGPTVGQTLPADHPFVMAAAFSKYTLAVTRRKEEEPRVTSVYDLFGPGDPVTSIDSFLDGESIVQTDLVAWVTVGKEHLPRTEDLPLISNFGTYFDLLPRNVFPVNAAMDVKWP